MYISNFQLNKYKSYFNRAPFDLAPRVNILVGQNNAGKTALIEALSLRFVGRPHRSLRTLPTPESQPNPITEVATKFTVSRDELLEMLLVPRGSFYLPA